MNKFSSTIQDEAVSSLRTTGRGRAGSGAPGSRTSYNSNKYAYPTPNAVFSSQRECYNGENYAVVSGEEPPFYSGGSGRNRFCE